MMAADCPVCRSESIVHFFEKSDIPAQDGVLYETQGTAHSAPTGRIELMFCNTCGFIWNRSFESSKIRYDAGYEISLTGSASYRDFLHDTANRLANRYLNSTSEVVEIGCGDGSFLREVCLIGKCRGVGYDPTFKPQAEEISQNSQTSQIRFVANFYPETSPLENCDLICCRHVLQQILNPSNPLDFLKSIQSRTRDSQKAYLYFEVPNGSFIFKPENIWNIVYEYHSYFTSDSLSALFTSSGFSVIEVSPCFKNGQYLGIEAGSTNGKDQFRPARIANNAETCEQLKNFQLYYQESLSNWQKQIESMQRSFKRIAAWGAGGRAISFFSALGIRQQIQFVVDINKHRQGKFLPVTGQEVVPPEFLLKYNPDAVLITNPSYETEIRNQISAMGLSPTIYVF